MKKKSVRKVSSAKKAIAKSPLKKKKSFSLKSWLLGGLVLLVASAYSLYQYNLQPKGLKVLELSGDFFDYIIPEPATINEICGGSCGLDATGKVVKATKPQPMAVSKSDTLRTINAKIEDEAEEAVGKTYQSNPVYTQTEQVQQVVQEMTSNLQSNASGVTFKDLVPEYDNKGKVKETKEKQEAEAKLQEIATTIAKETKEKLFIPESGSPNVPQSPGSVNSSNTCATSAFSVYEGETVIGNVTSDHTSNEIRGCHNGSWILVCTDTNSTIQAPASAAGFTSCSVSVPPIYKQSELGKGPNCYTEGGSIVVGNGSVVDGEDGSGKQCRGTKDLVDVTKYNGQWLTAEEIKDKKNQETAKAAMEKREKDKKTCEDNKGTYVIERGEGSCAPNMAYEKCIKSGSGYSWDDKSSSCKTINPIVADPTTVSDTIRSNAAATALIKNPNGKLMGGEATTNLSDCRYGGSPQTANGKKIAGKFECNDYTGTVPRTYNPAAAPPGFGGNQSTTKEGEYTYPEGKKEGARIRCNGNNLEQIDRNGGWSYNSMCDNGCWQGACVPQAQTQTEEQNTPSENDSPKIPDGEECGSKAECEQSCDGSYVTASVKKPGNRFSWNYNYCGSKADLVVAMTDTGYPYSFKEQRNIVINQETNKIVTKTVGDSCSNSPIFNNCDECPGEFSSVRINQSTKFMCGTQTEVNAIVNNNIDNKNNPPKQHDCELVSGSNSNCYDLCPGGDIQCDNGTNCSCYEKTEYMGTPALVNSARLPSAASTIATSTGTGSIVGALVAGGVCGLASLIAGPGFGVAAAISVPQCAAWGAGVGALAGGTTSYISTTSQPNKPYPLYNQDTNGTESQDSISKDEVKIENLQNKIEKILAKDGLAFSDKILVESECLNKDCIPVPNNPGSYIESSVVLDKAREMEIQLDFER